MQFNSEKAGEMNGSEQFLVATDSENNEIGAAFAVKDWNWLNIEVIYVEESMRGMGVGSGLLMAIEEWGITEGCTRSYLDTFSFQAVDFYKKHGYREFGTLSDFPIGHSRIFFQKSLT
jgi:GNAT superfamily N-acetyltransferase